MRRDLLLFFLMLPLLACSGCKATAACALFLLEAWEPDEYDQWEANNERSLERRREAEERRRRQQLEEVATSN